MIGTDYQKGKPHHIRIQYIVIFTGKAIAK